MILAEQATTHLAVGTPPPAAGLARLETHLFTRFSVSEIWLFTFTFLRPACPVNTGKNVETFPAAAIKQGRSGEALYPFRRDEG
jgi:hypothetical protein